MKKIALVHLGNAYKPEVMAYFDFFSKQGYGVDIYKKKTEAIKNYDLVWHFTGIDPVWQTKDQFIVHEYTCSSNPPFGGLKDKIKILINRKPHLRIFGSEQVAKKFNFHDDVPRVFRDAGIHSTFFDPLLAEIKPEYDFVYVGSMDPVRKVERLLEAFIGQLPDRTMLLVGYVPKNLFRRFSPYPNIHFQGYVPYTQIPTILKKARYGINFIPLVAPLIDQRPLKLIEYCAVGLKVISTNYPYVRKFEQERDGLFFKLNANLSNFRWDCIEQFDFKVPDVSDLRWEHVIARSGIERFLKRI